MNGKNALENPTQPDLRIAEVMPSCLRLPLIAKWFEMTEQRIKLEDYREINEYWLKRLFSNCEKEMIPDILENINRGWSIESIGDYYLHFPKRFDFNVMTLGYPKATDSKRILKLEHKGIEIRTGNQDWGAVPNKLYFVIVHGDVIA